MFESKLCDISSTINNGIISKLINDWKLCEIGPSCIKCTEDIKRHTLNNNDLINNPGQSKTT